MKIQIMILNKFKHLNEQKENRTDLNEFRGI